MILHAQEVYVEASYPICETHCSRLLYLPCCFVFCFYFLYGHMYHIDFGYEDRK